jgi:hypothetical protein
MDWMISCIEYAAHPVSYPMNAGNSVAGFLAAGAKFDSSTVSSPDARNGWSYN